MSVIWVPVVMLVLGILVVAAIAALICILWLINRTEVKLGPNLPKDRDV